MNNIKKIINLDKYKPIFDMAKKAGNLAYEDNIRGLYCRGSSKGLDPW